MTTSSLSPSPAELLLAHDATGAGCPVWLVGERAGLDIPGLGAEVRIWAAAHGFKGAARKLLTLPGSDGKLAGALLGIGDGDTGDPAGPGPLLSGLLTAQLPPGVYTLAGAGADTELAAVGWGLGAYRFRRYKSGNGAAAADMPRLVLDKSVDRARVLAIVEAVWLARDLINTPACDMGPAELEAAARDLGQRHGATVTSIVGDDLLTQNFPMIHAVGRASTRAPRLIDITWRRPGGRDR